MKKNNNGFSLTVLVIAIAVIIIITAVALISIKDFDKDKDISNFMNDLEEVKQHVIEYYAQNNTLPVIFDDNGNMKSGEDEIIKTFTEAKALDQLYDEDTGNYFYVDITKLGRIHLDDADRGYMVNEGSLNIYVLKPCKYKGTDYYTLTPFLLGKEIDSSNGADFEINVIGNPITWSKDADLLISVTNVKVGEAEGWNFKWGKTSEIIEGDNSNLNFFTYGDTIKITENGIYTIIVENPQGKTLQRKVVVSKIDNIPPIILYSSGDVFVHDAETGVKSIRCKVKETSRYNIDNETRNLYPQYYTMSPESYLDTQEDLLEKYLWGTRNIKGPTIEEYLKAYDEYYDRIVQYNAILANAETTSGERQNAQLAIEELNKIYPQFSYNNRRYSDSDRNIVLYVEDMAGNCTAYSAISRNELKNCEYSSGDSVTMRDARITINNNDKYTNTNDVQLYLQAIYAKYVFVTEEQVPTAKWEDFDSQYRDFTLSDGDGEKVVYAFFKDQAGKIVSAYDKIHLDTTLPSNNAPTVKYDDTNGLSITVNQTDTDIVDGVETQSGLTGIYQFAIKSETDSNYTWYSRVSAIPKLEKGVTYNIITKATDKAGNEQTSKPTTFKIDDNTPEPVSFKVGDYVNYDTYVTNGQYVTDRTNTGYTSNQNLSTENTKWRVFSISNDSIKLTTDKPVNQLYLSDIAGFFGGVNEINKTCENLYSSTSLNVKARGMTIEDLNKACNYTPTTSPTRYAFYPYKSGKQSGTIEYNGHVYTKVQLYGGTLPEGKFFVWDKGIVSGAMYRHDHVSATTTDPVLVTKTSYSYEPTDDMIANILGPNNGWLASSCIVLGQISDGTYCASHAMRIAGRDNITSEPLVYSYGAVDSHGMGVRPVVELSSSKFSINVEDTSKNGTASAPWEIKRK